MTTNMPDFSKSFKFHHCDSPTEYTWHPDGSVTWNDGENNPGTFLGGRAKGNIQNGIWTVMHNTLLDKIKAFTLSTNASVFINNGTYEIYYDDIDTPAKATTDEQMEALMKAFVLIEKASHGKKP